MNKTEALRELLQQKTARQALLKTKSRQLSVLDVNLTESKFGRFFGTSYFFIKRFLTLLLGIALFLFALLLLIYPEFILEDESFKADMISEYKKDYGEMADFTVRKALNRLVEDSSYTIEDTIRYLDDAFEEAIEREILSAIRRDAVLIIFLSLVFLYISRMTKKLQKRNVRISRAESLTQDVIKSFREMIKAEEKELELLKSVVEHEADSNNPEPSP